MGSKILSKLNFFSQFIYIDTNGPWKVLAVLGNYDVKNIPFDNGDYIVIIYTNRKKDTESTQTYNAIYRTLINCIHEY